MGVKDVVKSLEEFGYYPYNHLVWYKTNTNIDHTYTIHPTIDGKYVPSINTEICIDGTDIWLLSVFGDMMLLEFYDVEELEDALKAVDESRNSGDLFSRVEEYLVPRKSVRYRRYWRRLWKRCLKNCGENFGKGLFGVRVGHHNQTPH